jgi:hypothetical protein
LAKDFQEGRLKMLNINGSYITLVPKVAAPVKVKNCSRGRRPSMPMTVREEEAGAPLPLQSGCSPATTLTVLIVPRNQPSSGPLPSRRRPCHHIFPATAALPVLAQPRRLNAAWHPLERPRRPNQNHQRRVARGAAGARRTGEP